MLFRSTDIIIIVVAADDGVKAQTEEVISHAKASGCPIIVAMNKMDKESANPDMVKAQMAEEKLTYNGNNIGYKLINFWQWSVSDILSNATRGRFAEFIVGTAIEFDNAAVRDEWKVKHSLPMSAISRRNQQGYRD